MTSPGTDNALMAEVQRGNLAALGTLYRRHRFRVRGLCLRMTANSHDADDLVQEVFLRVLRYRASFSGDASFTTWLYRITRNAALTHLQRRDPRYAADPEAPVEVTADDPRLANLAEAFAHLSPADRRVLQLSRYEGLPYRDIAKQLGTTVSAVKVRVHRAVRRLRDEYQRLEHEDHEVRRRD